MAHVIDQALLRRAADQLLTIIGAGCRDELKRQYWDRVWHLGAGHRLRNQVRDLEIESDAELLALLTDAPVHQCRAAICEAAGDMPKRQIGLAVLREMSGEVRRRDAQARRETYRRWRS